MLQRENWALTSAFNLKENKTVFPFSDLCYRALQPQETRAVHTLTLSVTLLISGCIPTATTPPWMTQSPRNMPFTCAPGAACTAACRTSGGRASACVARTEPTRSSHTSPSATSSRWGKERARVGFQPGDIWWNWATCCCLTPELVGDQVTWPRSRHIA